MYGVIRERVEFAGTSLYLDKGEPVHLTQAVNQPDKTQFFATPIGREQDSMLISRGDVKIGHWQLDENDLDRIALARGRYYKLIGEFPPLYAPTIQCAVAMLQSQYPDELVNIVDLRRRKLKCASKADTQKT